MNETESRRVAIAGATGFVGGALVRALHGRHEVIALSRSGRPPEGTEVEARECDLYSLLDIERGLQGVDTAVYLVHSMSASAGLTQASFADLDLLLADNFARAAAKAGVRRIVYLGGLVPSGPEVSRHLQSRREVEEALGAYGVPVLALRAGLIVGPGGSSMEILLRLVERLPAMLCPSWTATPTQPIDLRDVVRALELAIEGEWAAGHYDIGGPDVMSYREMLRRTGLGLGREPRLWSVPLLSPGLSKLWVSTVSRTSMQLVGPLVESLEHPMVARDNPLQAQLVAASIPFDQALADALAARRLPRASSPSRRAARTARSVQRLPARRCPTAQEAADEYLRWLPRYVRPLLRVRLGAAGRVRFYLSFTPLLLLELQLAPGRSASDRPLYYVTGGVLQKPAREGERRARLEFRQVLSGRALLAAIHDFRPSLPWWLYVRTHARVHLWVMRGFGRHLGRVEDKALGAPPHL